MFTDHMGNYIRFSVHQKTRGESEAVSSVAVWKPCSYLRTPDVIAFCVNSSPT